MFCRSTCLDLTNEIASVVSLVVLSTPRGLKVVKSKLSEVVVTYVASQSESDGRSRCPNY